MAQYGFFIDLSRCIGCNACLIACKQWHDIAPGPVKWMRVYQWENGSFPNIGSHILPLPCLHCQNPVCVDACPNKALYKEDKYGAVLVDTSKCTGERKCWKACPYGAPQFADDKTGTKMSKCNMCIDRLEQGLTPICVLSCSTRALEFGPIDELQAKYGRSNVQDVAPADDSPTRQASPAVSAEKYLELIAEGNNEETSELNINCPSYKITAPSVVFKKTDPKKQVISYDPVKALDLWQKRHPDGDEELTDIFTDASEVLNVPDEIYGRNKLVLKPKNVDELMFYTTDDE